MSDPVVVPGDKLHIITRRNLREDLRRHFAGEVVAASGGLFEVRGFAFVFHGGKAEYLKRPEVHTRVFSLGDAAFIVHKLPPEVVMDSLVYRVVREHLVVTDMKNFSLDINEFGISS